MSSARVQHKVTPSYSWASPLRRHPVLASVAGTISLAAVLLTLTFAFPLGDNLGHFSQHMALGVPFLLLLILGIRTWPRPGPEPAPRLARGTLLAGIALACLGLFTEAVGAFGYAEDQYSSANDLQVLHDVGVAVWPVGFSLLMAGAIMSAGVGLAARRGAAGSRIVSAAMVLAVVAVIAFIVGGFIFGY